MYTVDLNPSGSHITLGGPHNCNKTKIKVKLNSFYGRGLHICNKTKIKEFYKTCRTVVAYLVLVANDSIAL